MTLPPSPRQNPRPSPKPAAAAPVDAEKIARITELLNSTELYDELYASALLRLLDDAAGPPARKTGRRTAR